MMELDGGEERPRIYDRESLRQWLDAQPPDRRREVAVVITARVALRVLPTIERNVSISWAREFGTLALAVFWATALARVAAKYPTRAKGLRAADAAEAAAAAAATAATRNDAVTAYAAADAAATAAYAKVAAAGAVATAYASADAAAAYAADHPIWRSISADIAALEAGRLPSDLAGDPLWTQGAPTWATERWRLIREFLAESHWRPWLDWYERRLDGVELSEEIELLFATLPVDPKEKDPAEQNTPLAQEIARLTEATSPPKESWDFFISYSTPDDSFARETASVLEEAGYSTFAMFKDIAVGNNLVREMQNGLSRSTRLIALHSPNYEKSDHCRAEWAYAYNRDPSGRERRLITFLVRETELNALAQQIVYKSLVGLTQEQRKAAILAAVAPSPPGVPKQSPGPHVEIDPATGAIVTAKPESLDAEGNNVARLRTLQPQVTRLARDLVASVSANEQPELHGSASRYADNVDRALVAIDFDQLWGEGVFLEARAAAAAKGAGDGMREPLSAAALATLNALMEVHGPFILSTRAGLENLALSREFHLRPEEARDEEAATRELARELAKNPEIVSPETAELFAHIVEQPESSVHPERSGAFKSGMTQNIAIVLVAGAGLRVMRLVIGDDASKPLRESLEASEPYRAYLEAAGLLKDKLDRSTEIDFKKLPLDLYKKFVLKHEALLRRALGGRERARWLHEHIDWLKRENEARV